jgi:competence protein ComEC
LSLDFRLARALQRATSLRLDPILLVGVALCAAATGVVTPLPALVGAGGVLLLVGQHLNLRSGLVLALCFAVGGARAWLVLERFDVERSAVRDAFGPPQRCSLEGTIATSPTSVGGRPLYVLVSSHAECESAEIPAGSQVRLGGGPDGLARGDRVSAVAQIAPIELLFNRDLPDPLPGAARRGVTLSGTAFAVDVEARSHGVTAFIDRARAHARRRISATFASAAEPMARALVLGENDLDPDDDAAFRKSGLSHMLAVSGTHLVFAVLSLVRLVTALLLRWERFSCGRDVGRYAALVGVVLSLFYADFAGGSGSALRAAYMLCAVLSARALGRHGSATRALGLSLVLGWLFDPLVAFDISFLLSAAATSGLLLLSEPLSRPCEHLSSRFARWLGEAVATTLSAMIPCAPLLALMSPEITFAGIIANVIAAPLGETIALPLCLLHCLSAGWPALEAGIALVASGALLAVRLVARESAAGLVLGRLAGRSAGWHRFWMLSAGVSLALIEVATRRSSAPRNVVRFTALAVGQGDSSLVDLPDGRVVLIDGGGAPAGGPDPGTRVVLPVLRARRRTRLDVVVLSHPHPDHFGGLLAVARSVPIGEVWDTAQGTREGAGPVYAEFRRELAARGVPVLGPRELCGKRRHFGAAQLDVLGPCPDYTPGRDANDNSIVLRLEFGARSFLLMGDAEARAEDDLVTAYGDALRSDVLKVGHHGSRTSSSALLLSHVKPELATISCGVRNRFGHPVPSVVERLSQFGAEVLRTDHDGALEIVSDGRAVTWSRTYPNLLVHQL